MKKIVLSLLVGALLVSAAVCTVNAQEAPSFTVGQISKDSQYYELSQKIGKEWRDFALEKQPQMDELKEKIKKEQDPEIKKQLEKELTDLEKKWKEAYQRYLSSDKELDRKADQIKSTLNQTWREKNLELAKTLGAIKVKDDYEATMCALVMVLEKMRIPIDSIATNPGIIRTKSPNNPLLDKDFTLEIEGKYYSELEEVGVGLSPQEKARMKESTRIYGQGDFPSPLKIYGLTICVHQVWLNKQEKIPWYTAVNVYLKEISRDTLYPVFAEECYKRLIELFEQEGLTIQKD
ncbi:MAG: hypothetical protein IKQ24_08195 [Verrucomicrobia bacterium]|nr:hypothetical protein [Verrucomicrobiota bacterium]